MFTAFPNINGTAPVADATDSSFFLPQQASSATSPSFMDTLRTAFDKVNELDEQADKLAVDFATGKTSDIHQVMIADQKAEVALHMTTQVRNKVVEAYQEIMRMSM